MSNTPVYIDFTAQWCATCQLNKKRAYTPEVVALMKAKRVVALKADKTKPNPQIEAGPATTRPHRHPGQRPARTRQGSRHPAAPARAGRSVGGPAEIVTPATSSLQPWPKTPTRASYPIA